MQSSGPGWGSSAERLCHFRATRQPAPPLYTCAQMHHRCLRAAVRKIVNQRMGIVAAPLYGVASRPCLICEDVNKFPCTRETKITISPWFWTRSLIRSMGAAPVLDMACARERLAENEEIAFAAHDLQPLRLLTGSRLKSEGIFRTGEL